ncbi:MAG: ATP-binding cassette domain-containing protein [Thermomicrobiales bacterium]
MHGAKGNNLKNVTVDIPLGKFIAITGVSGSGKSTLITDTLHRRLAQQLHSAKALPAPHEDITGIEHIDKVIEIDQSPIGRTPRSNPATYTEFLFTPVRELFASMPEAKSRGYMPGRFSFNVKGGRCEACKGEGIIQIGMNCPTFSCRARSVTDVAITRSARNPLQRQIDRRCARDDGFRRTRVLRKHSGRGEQAPHAGRKWDSGTSGSDNRLHSSRVARRSVKLASELSKRDRPNALHPRRTDDRTAFRRHRSPARIAAAGGWRQHHRRDRAQSRCHQIGGLADRSRSEGGAGGGQVIAQGTPEMVADDPASFTGVYLKPFLEQRSIVAAD